MGNGSRASHRAYPAARFLTVGFFVLAILMITQTLLVVENARATTIEQYSLHLSGDVSEVQFQMRGTFPKWHLRSHGQELSLDLEHTRIAAPLEPALVPAGGAVARINIRDFGGGRVRLGIRVRGQVDYVVAEGSNVLIIRIASSERKVDLAEPLLREMEENRLSAATRVPASPVSGPATLDRSPALVENQPRVSPEAGRAVSQSAGQETVIAGSGREASAGFLSGYTTAGPSGSRPFAQPVKPVSHHVRTVPWVEQGSEPMVVVDAGHGGFDPGTETAGGIAEKNVALAIARRLVMALEARGIRAELTRYDDTFLRLGQRTELANRLHADLFVSIHLNSSPDWGTSGIETYYLNNTTDRATIRLARIENGGDYGGLEQSNLNYILTNLRQDYKAHESSSLARIIEADVVANVETTLGTNIKALGARMGPFYVLVGAEMPSVLIECGFLSNPRESQLLVQPSYQAALADGIAVAILQYFNPDAAVGNL